MKPSSTEHLSASANTDINNEIAANNAKKSAEISKQPEEKFESEQVEEKSNSKSEPKQKSGIAALMDNFAKSFLIILDSIFNFLFGKSSKKSSSLEMSETESQLQSESQSQSMLRPLQPQYDLEQDAEFNEKNLTAAPSSQILKNLNNNSAEEENDGPLTEELEEDFHNLQQDEELTEEELNPISKPFPNIVSNSSIDSDDEENDGPLTEEVEEDLQELVDSLRGNVDVSGADIEAEKASWVTKEGSKNQGGEGREI
jgi:hypothetical protein